MNFSFNLKLDKTLGLKPSEFTQFHPDVILSKKYSQQDYKFRLTVF